MKKGYTHITIVLDRSGSMGIIKDDVIGGFNTFIEEQKSVPGEATVTLAQFNDEYQVVYNGAYIKYIGPLNNETFVPNGWTRLYDAVGRAIEETEVYLRKMKDNERPEKVVFVIFTDGQENDSKNYLASHIKDMIKHQEQKYNWQFVFLGANQDACFEAAKIGINIDNAITYAANSLGVHDATRSISKNLVNYRLGNVETIAFTNNDYQKQKEAGAQYK